MEFPCYYFDFGEFREIKFNFGFFIWREHPVCGRKKVLDCLQILPKWEESTLIQLYCASVSNDTVRWFLVLYFSGNILKLKGFMSQISNVMIAGIFRSSELYPNDRHWSPVIRWMQKILWACHPEYLIIFFSRLSLFNFITKFYFYIFKPISKIFTFVAQGES